MNSDLFGAPTLVGLKVKLDRAIDREQPCCDNVCVIGAGKGPHTGELICAGCGQHRGWLSKPAASFVESTAKRFGAPEIITLHQARTYDDTATEQHLNEADKQQRIQHLLAWIAHEGFVPKDFFLTQPPPPQTKRWWRRERRRRTIARRMAQWGLTAHDLSLAGKPPTATAEAMSPVNANAMENTAMANIDDFYPSKYLRASDLKGKEVDVTIDRVEAEEFEQDGEKRNKPVVHFRNNGIKPLVCNKTNATRIATALGDRDYESWSGKQVRLYPDMEEFKGQVHEVIRVRRAPAPIGEDLNDEIPH